MTGIDVEGLRLKVKMLKEGARGNGKVNEKRKELVI